MAENGDAAARGHHFLSQCYLKGFTQQGAKNSKLVALHLVNRKTLPPTIPHNFAKKRDFNRVEMDGMSPNYLETQLGIFEGLADKAIRNVERTGLFAGDDRIVILNLMALFAVRSPYSREYWSSVRNLITRTKLSMAAANVGGITNGVLITSELKNYIDEGRFKIETHQNEHIKAELSVLDTVIQLLVRKKWGLLYAKDDLTFITCDRPVVLSWKEDKGQIIGPGFGSPGSQVCFSLTKKLALIGDFDGEDCVIAASERLMGCINSAVFSSAAQWVYTEAGDFIFLKHTGESARGITAFWEYFGSHVAA